MSKRTKTIKGTPTKKENCFSWVEGVGKNKKKFHPYTDATAWEGNVFKPSLEI